MIKILHVISGLDVGGAEMMLYKLLKNIDRTKYEVEVISLTDIGIVGSKIEELDIPVSAVGMKSLKEIFKSLIKLVKHIKKSKPNIVQTWLYHGDLFGGIVARLLGIPVIWGLHNSNIEPGKIKKSTVLVAKICGRISKWVPTLIISCSNAASEIHIAIGYQKSKIVSIPNGFETEVFKRDNEMRKSVRRELNIDEKKLLVGIIARFDPQKDHLNFIRAASEVNKEYKEVEFLLCGKGMDTHNEKLIKWIEEYNLSESMHLLGQREDIAAIDSALDIFVLSSVGEAFPIAVGEAMCCEVPCVVTDVGDSAVLVDDTGYIVKPKDHKALALAVKKMLELGEEERRRLGEAARLRMVNNYSIEAYITKLENTYKAILGILGER